MPPLTPHALVVGGTGMLAGVSLHLSRRGYTVSVVARGAGGLTRLQRAAAALPGRIVSVPVDYRDSAAFRHALRESVQQHGPVRLAVAWIHSDASEAAGVVADVLGGEGADCRIVAVHSSAYGDPAHRARATPSPYEDRAGLDVRHVVLGFRIENGRSRWLTDGEISDGVIAAAESGAAWSVVGTVEPWSARP